MSVHFASHPDESCGDCVADLELLNDDSGFFRILERVELHHLCKSEKRKLGARWRKKRQRLIPAATTVFKDLESYCVPEETDRAFLRCSQAW
jgi:hypothetical protein